MAVSRGAFEGPQPPPRRAPDAPIDGHRTKPPGARALLLLTLVVLVLAIPATALAQSPWENAATVLQQAFTSTIARAFSLIAIVVGGLTLAYGEGSGNRRMAGIIFGVGMAVGAVNFMAWLFPG